MAEEEQGSKVARCRGGGVYEGIPDFGGGYAHVHIPLLMTHERDHVDVARI
ncbi:uncharacterized protein G2W53_023551 [Senna tora]|uniref:Uncharacterized protein n=1 Tax=Senna tora TaxID=362788 RepID=A0A834TAN3_9FABA|nr:uncharacterized protein G2W53_023551 [Senna tora]